jgi:hypothetical protein
MCDTWKFTRSLALFTLEVSNYFRNVPAYCAEKYVGYLVPEIKAVCSMFASLTFSTKRVTPDPWRLRLRRVPYTMDAPDQGTRFSTRCCIRVVVGKRGQCFSPFACRCCLRHLHQGPLVHVACCMSYFLSQLFREYRTNEGSTTVFFLTA